MVLSRSFVYKLLLILVILLAGTSVFFYNKFSSLKANPSKAEEAEVERLVAVIGEHIVLPKDETPTVATVADPDALKGQSFFVDAKKGDKVLIYTNAKKAILYDPTVDKIITVAPLTIGDSPTNAVTREDIEKGEEEN